MKNTLEGTKSRLDDAEEQISDLEDTVEMTQFEQWMEKHKDSLKNVWNSIKHIDVCIIVGKRERGRNVHEEILVENLPNIMKRVPLTINGLNCSLLNLYSLYPVLILKIISHDRKFT